MSNRVVLFGRPCFSQKEISAAGKVLRSGWLVEGPKVAEFEENFGEYAGTRYAVAVSSCTAALHLSLLGLQIGHGDEVIVSAQTHAATAHAVTFVGAKAVFADVSLKTGNVTAENIRGKINSKTKAIMLVHFAGLSCDMNPILRIAGEHKLLIIEDCAHAFGGKYKGKNVGSFGVCGCFSFYPTKQITTIEGGMLATNDEKLAQLARKQRSFGIDKPAWLRTSPGKYDITHIGYNYRMSDVSVQSVLSS